MEPVVMFGPNARSSDVTGYSLGVLRDVLVAAGIPQVRISSTQRDAHNQARVMFDNLETYGVAHQKKLYAAAGDAVIDVYAAEKAAGHPADQVKAAMEAKIDALGPETVSHHAADPKVLNVFDVEPSSVPDDRKKPLENAAKSDRRVSRFLTPPGDPGFHFEIPQPAPADQIPRS